MSQILLHAKFEIVLILRCLFLSFQLPEGVQTVQDEGSGWWPDQSLRRCSVNISVAAAAAAEASCCDSSMHICHLFKSQPTSTGECPPQRYLLHRQQRCLLTISRVPARSQTVAYEPTSGISVEIPGVWLRRAGETAVQHRTTATATVPYPPASQHFYSGLRTFSSPGCIRPTSFSASSAANRRPLAANTWAASPESSSASSSSSAVPAQCDPEQPQPISEPRRQCNYQQRHRSLSFIATWRQ